MGLPRNDSIHRLRKRNECPTRAGEYHILSAWHPVDLPPEQKEGLRDRRLQVYVAGRGCACQWATVASLLGECPACRKSLAGVFPPECIVCKARDLGELVILHGEHGEVICYSCLGLGPKEDLLARSRQAV